MNEHKSTVLVVDDTPANIDILRELLREDYKIKVAINGAGAIRIATSDNPPDLILLDVMMPEMDGYEVIQRLSEMESTASIPVIFVTALDDLADEQKGLDLGAVDYITKPYHPPLVKARVNNHIELKKYRDNLEELVQLRTAEIALTQEVTIESLATLAETRDPETGGHIRRTQTYIKILALELQKNEKFSNQLDDKLIDLLYQSAPLHDIGKVGVLDSILLKPGKLTDEEFEEMKKHTVLGRDALRNSSEKLGDNSFLLLAQEIAYTHQERWDGSGYPQQLSGTSIPLSGRLMAVADVYDALISKRVYKPPMPHSQAVEIIIDGSGSHFDPDLVEAFKIVEKEFLKIAIEFADFEEEKKMLLK